MPMPTTEMLEKRLAERSSAVKRLLNSADGAFLMEALEEAFLFGRLIGATEQETYANLGAREVVLHLRELRDSEEGEYDAR